VSKSLEQSLRRSSRAVIAAQVASQLVSLAVLAILARRLGPEPYGLLGMVMPVLLLVRILVTSGLDMVTIQQSEVTDRQVSALFWVNQALGMAMALATAASAPLLVWFFENEELGWLTVALAGTSVAFVLGVQHQALLQRKLRLGTLAGLRLAALTLGGVAAVTLGLFGYGVWALVVQQYVEYVALAALLWTAEPWRPGFHFRRTGSRPLVRFGGQCTVSHLMLYLVTNVDKVLVGRLFGTVPLALYGQAFNLVMKPVHVLITPLTGLMFPTLSRAASNPGQFAKLLLGFFRFILLAMLPMGVGLAIVGPEAMRVLAGPKWADAGPILAMLAVVVPVQGCYNALAYVFAAAGRTGRLSLASVASAIVLCAAYSLGLYLGWLAGEPLWGIALGYTVGLTLIVFPPYLGFALATVKVPCREWLSQLHPTGAATLAMAALVAASHWILGHMLAWPDLPLLAVEILVGVASYVLFARRAILWFVREGLRNLADETA
jgi:O-antigen/teichoic acid export membrane protein